MVGKQMAATRPLKIAYVDEQDSDFIRWTSNLLRRFIRSGQLVAVSNAAAPDLLIAATWKRHDISSNVPTILISNENWSLFPPPTPVAAYKAVLGLTPPPEPCTFIAYPYGAVHYDLPVESLYDLRLQFLSQPKTRFCCFVTSNCTGELGMKRIALFKEINRWKHVDSGGMLYNNIGGRLPRGLDFLRWIAQFKYMICLENSKAPGYITEKPFQAWFASTVPIYDGGCVEDLNPDAIVNASGDVLAQLEQLEADPVRYQAKRNAALRDTPLSLDAFERQFGEAVLNTL